ncbi:unnamed protein product [Gongylonema pulchrum]|uniref:O(6)-methylguanine-induced apoptosis 2 n=1 Tax=Gongylonema pulchrum TaxID=637853 RepID=A0A183DF12_9BILA|nr:unnamed protein product [Gongylonema pulchrum]
MASSANFNTVAMLPGTPYFCPTAPGPSTPKWLSEGHPHPEYQIPKFVSRSGTRMHPVPDPLRYPADVRWPSEFAYQIQTFHPAAAAGRPSLPDAYPTDPFPSTSMAQLPGNCCFGRLENTGPCYYPNTMLPTGYAAPSPNNYFAATQHIAQWKVIIVKFSKKIKQKLKQLSISSEAPGVMNPQANGKKSRVTQPVANTPPYRTGPGTNSECVSFHAIYL